MCGAGPQSRGYCARTSHVFDGVRQILFGKGFVKYCGIGPAYLSMRATHEDTGPWTIFQYAGNRRDATALQQIDIDQHQTWLKPFGTRDRLVFCGDNPTDGVAHLLQYFGEEHSDHRIVLDDKDSQGLHHNLLPVFQTILNSAFRPYRH